MTGLRVEGIRSGATESGASALGSVLTSTAEATRLMAFRVLREGGPHLLSRDVVQRQCLVIVTAGEEHGDRAAVLAVRLQVCADG
jgi:hypothetical protein